MKKIFWLAVICSCLLGTVCFGYTKLEQQQIEFEEVGDYIRELDGKIISAREKKQINKLAELKELKRLALLRAQKLKEEIAQVTLPESGNTNEENNKYRSWRRQADLKTDYIKGWVGATGFSGGGAVVELGYPLNIRSFPLICDFGLGVGNGYSFLKIGFFKTIPIQSFYAGAELNLVGYSQSVSSIPGVAGTVSGGAHVALGAFGGMEIGDFDAQLGYNSSLGVELKLVYGF